MFTTKLESELEVVSSILLVKPTNKLYYALKTIEANRNILPDSIKELKNSIIENNALRLVPLLIDSNYYIIDGQTRYEAAKELSYPFHIQIVDHSNYTMQDLISINTTQKNWKLFDYLNHYTISNSPEYQKFSAVYETNKITMGVLIAIFNQDWVRKRKYSKEFKEGNLKCDTTILNHVNDTLYKIRKISKTPLNPMLEKSTIKNQHFQQAILAHLLTETFDFMGFISKVAKYPNEFNKLRKTSDFIEHIKEINNSHKLY